MVCQVEMTGDGGEEEAYEDCQPLNYDHQVASRHVYFLTKLWRLVTKGGCWRDESEFH